jgi:hypothetical protein
METQDFPRSAFTMLRDRPGHRTPTAVGNHEPQGHCSSAGNNETVDVTRLT